MARQALVLKPLERATPFAFPLMVERLREKLSNESVADRIARMLAPLEKAAGSSTGHTAEDVNASLAFGREGAPDKATPRPPRERRPHRPRRPR